MRPPSRWRRALLGLALASCASPWSTLRDRSRQCVDERRDCDGDPDNGCEVDTATDRNHCGQCGARAAIACVSGRALEVRSIASAAGVVCASVTGERLGGLRCWGSNAERTVSEEGPPTARAIPTDPLPQDTTEVFTLALGDGFGCAVRGDSKRLRCWGATLARMAGVTQATLEAAAQVDALGVGARHACVGAPVPGTDRSALLCFGDNDRGQLSAERPSDGALVPVRNSAGDRLSVPMLRGIVAGSAHTCAWNNEDIWCWGANESGQLGRATALGPSGLAAAKIPLPSDVVVHDVSAAGESTCAVLSSSSGDRDAGADDGGDSSIRDGSSGDGSPHDATSDGAVHDAATDAAFDAASPFNPCASTVRANKRVVCWGAIASESRCGSRVIGAVRLESGGLLEEVERVFVGARHACAITTSRVVHCWGDSSDGRLADGAAHGALVSGVVPSLRGARSLAITGSSVVLPPEARSARHEAFCALFDRSEADARVRCWGPNVSGQLGDSERGPTVLSMPSDVRW